MKTLPFIKTNRVNQLLDRIDLMVKRLSIGERLRDSLNITDSKSLYREMRRLFRWGMELVQTLFPVLLITFLILILLETISNGSVSSYINLNQLLVTVIIVGIIAVLSAPSKADSKKTERLTRKNIFIIICAGIGGAVIIWYKTRDIGWLSYVISLLGGGLIVLLPALIWRGDEVDETEEDNSKGN